MREDSQRGLGLTFPFVGIPSFLRSPICTDPKQLDADVAIMGAPTDEGSPWVPGSRFGPRAIREQSLRFWGSDGYYDPELRRTFLEREKREERIADVGDAEIIPTDVVGSFNNITALTREILDRGAMPVVLGGDHAISYPVVRAFDQPLHVVHFDAHLDYFPFLHGFEYTNAHAFRHIARMPHVQTLTQVGIRSIRNTREMMEDSLDDGNRILTMKDCRERQAAGLLELLPEGAPCYVSVDIDVLDMPLVPGCASAEPNGMAYGELTEFLFALAEHTLIVGFDLVEVNPKIDLGSGATSYLAAHSVVEFLGRVCEQPRWKAAREGRQTRGTHAERDPLPPVVH